MPPANTAAGDFLPAGRAGAPRQRFVVVSGMAPLSGNVPSAGADGNCSSPARDADALDTATGDKPGVEVCERRRGFEARWLKRKPVFIACSMS